MKKTISSLRAIALAGVSVCALALTASAQNVNFAQGHVVLAFQKTSGTGSNLDVYASLGDRITYRDAYVNGTNLLNIVNINATMAATYGSDWASQNEIWGHAAGAQNNGGGLGNTLTNGDPNSTYYATRARPVLGTPGLQNSNSLVFNSFGANQAASSSIFQLNEFVYGAQTTDLVAAFDANFATANVNKNVPVGGVDLQLSQIPQPGVTQQGSATALGSFAGIDDVVFAWDFYRVQSRNNINGQFGQGDNNVLWLGTFVVADDGNVSFIAAQEPGTSQPPVITTDPSNQTVTAPGSAAFEVAATGDAPLSYQWQVSTDGGESWSDIGADAATYSTGATNIDMNGYQYRVVVTNDFGSATSESALLTVNPAPIPVPPAITEGPQDAQVTAPGSATFGVVATGDTPLFYEWQVSTDGGESWSDIGANAATYSTGATNIDMNGYQYRVVVTNASGSATSESALLTVNPAEPVPPAITEEPQDAQVTAPGSATFGVVATGDTPLFYQWQVSTDGGLSWSDIGANAATYSTGATNIDMNGYQYRVVVTNASGSATSESALLTVEPPAPVFENIPGFGRVEVLPQDNRYRSESYGELAFADGGANRSRAFSYSLGAWLDTDGQSVRSAEYGTMSPANPGWVNSEFFGLVHFGEDGEQYAGWVWSQRFGWMRFVQSGNQNFLWAHDLQTWMSVNSNGSFNSFDFGLLTPIGGFDRYHSNLIGNFTTGDFGGWVASDRFGFVWAARNTNGVWFYSLDLQDWLGVLAPGWIWSTNEGRFLE